MNYIKETLNKANLIRFSENYQDLQNPYLLYYFRILEEVSVLPNDINYFMLEFLEYMNQVDVQDIKLIWYRGSIIDLDEKENCVLVHYIDWANHWDEWIKLDSGRLAPLFTKTFDKLKINDVAYHPPKCSYSQSRIKCECPYNINKNYEHSEEYTIKNIKDFNFSISIEEKEVIKRSYWFWSYYETINVKNWININFIQCRVGVKECMDKQINCYLRPICLI